MHIEFNDDHGVNRWRKLYQRTSWLKVAAPRKTIKCLCFLAAPALVASMMAAGIPVRYHPIDRNKYVVPWDKISDLTLRDLVGRKDFVFLSTVSFLVSPTGSNQTLTSDPTWNNSNNTIECIGAGGSGGVANGAAPKSCAGGAGGDYAKISNFTFATPGTTTATYQLGTGGTAISGTLVSNGNAGGDTWFNSATFAGCSVGGRGGGGGQGNSTATANGGAVGNGNTSTGTTINTGGRGGNVTTNTGEVGTGAGGAGGLNAAGNQGVDSSGNSTAASTNGGQGDGTHGGAAGTSGGGTGGNGTEWDASHGSGGGGGGNDASLAVAGSGGNYGGGGGGGTSTSTTHPCGSGAGIQGIIVLTWTPVPRVTNNEDGTGFLIRSARSFVVRGYNVR